MVSITHLKYKNKESIVLENSRIRAEFLPEPGGKLASLISKEKGYEFLVQRDGATYLDQPYDGVYVKGECSGNDDMFPTIDLCHYGKEPWKGIKMADHGEVWPLPWNYKINKDSFSMWVKGVRFPYELKKNISFTNENTLRIDYELTNNSESDFEFLWAGHFMINIEESARVMVPDDCTQTVTIITSGNGKFGDINNWPENKDKDGNKFRADICRPLDSKGFEKYYFVNKLKNGWCELIYPDNKKKIKISFSVDTVPYLGILMNENGWNNLYNIFIEPCTVCYDRPDVAKKYGQISHVPALGKYKWYVKVSI
ncbi:MAG: hypothetical protein M0R21_12125 [Lentimicrobiaceae bacterium]|nr:hypothetical protein [Lentimicrobiaceae bacterium]